MRNQINTRSTGKKLEFSFRAFASVLSVVMALTLALIAPFLVGKLWGHGLGLLLAIGDVMAWLYLNHKHFGIQRVALSTEIVWLSVLVFITVALFIEATHFCAFIP